MNRRAEVKVEGRSLANAVVLISQHRVLAYTGNLAQNAPLDPSRNVLYLTSESAHDEQCIEAHYPGRTWFRATATENLVPLGKH